VQQTLLAAQVMIKRFMIKRSVLSDNLAVPSWSAEAAI